MELSELIQVSDIWTALFAYILGIAGLTGAVVVILIKFISELTAIRLSKKYEADLQINVQKEVEKFKNGLEGKQYISKLHYDTEFEIYRLLSKVFFDMIASLSSLYAPEMCLEPPFQDKYIEIVMKRVDSVGTRVLEAQNTLFQNAAFISMEFFQQYKAILELGNGLYLGYVQSVHSGNARVLVIDKNWHSTKYKRVKAMEEMLLDLNEELRTYLQSLVIID